MNDADDQLEIKNVSILVFSVGGVRFGVESSQIAAIDPDRTIADFKIIKLKEVLELPDQNDSKDETAALEFRPENCTSSLFIVDSIEDIVEIPCSEIKLLPALIAERVLAAGIWGVFELNGKMVILIDFYNLRPGIASAALDPGILAQIHTSQEDRI